MTHPFLRRSLMEKSSNLNHVKLSTNWWTSVFIYNKINQFSLNDCYSKLLWHVFYILLSYGFGYGLWPKAEVFQGWTFGYSRRWKLSLWSNTGFKPNTQLIHASIEYERFLCPSWSFMISRYLVHKQGHFCY